MKVGITLLALAMTTIATMAGTTFAGQDSARGAGRARASGPGVNAIALIAKGRCDDNASATLGQRPASLPAATGAVRPATATRGAGRARPSSTMNTAERGTAKRVCETLAADGAQDGLGGQRSSGGPGRTRTGGNAKPVVPELG
jgi:hypothetical protein